jgi:hypothetical protein
MHNIALHVSTYSGNGSTGDGTSRGRFRRFCLTIFIRSACAALRSGVHEALMFAPMALRSIFTRPCFCRKSCASRQSLFAQSALKAFDLFASASGVLARREFLDSFSGVKLASMGSRRAARASGGRLAQLFLRDSVCLARYPGSCHLLLSLTPCFIRASVERGFRLLTLSRIRARNSGSVQRRFSLSEWPRRDWSLTARWNDPPCLFSWQFAQRTTRFAASSAPPLDRGIIWCM